MVSSIIVMKKIINLTEKNECSWQSDESDVEEAEIDGDNHDFIIKREIALSNDL